MEGEGAPEQPGALSPSFGALFRMHRHVDADPAGKHVGRAVAASAPIFRCEKCTTCTYSIMWRLNSQSLPSFVFETCLAIPGKGEGGRGAASQLLNHQNRKPHDHDKRNLFIYAACIEAVKYE